MTRLKLWRTSSGLSQRDAAARVGVGIASYQFLESGRMKPSRDQQAKLRRLFGTNAAGMLDVVPDEILVAAGAATP